MGGNYIHEVALSSWIREGLCEEKAFGVYVNKNHGLHNIGYGILAYDRELHSGESSQ